MKKEDKVKELVSRYFLQIYKQGLRDGKEDMSIKVNEIIIRECEIWKRGFKEHDTVLENFKEKLIYEINSLTQT